ncbi:MAG: hypothetical protein FWD25_09215 [Clostridia bacterium]|nr:hypothetical protein [Clostridia bacterium]
MMNRGGDGYERYHEQFTMSNSLEGFLLLNASMNAALLCVTLRWSGQRILA